ncbi:MFS transporter [Filimonas effusa]|uniref:MFS transporter n=1 Tax=Filimonas effusa TaxID=2508721 RepID=A0A4Q1DC50_9BACT|nr:MFS transporter [Filimonas effusa]RXK86920.1 MFS transporter [Filimonas effusa]
MLRQASLKRKKIATTLAFISIPLSGFITDIYLPSLPSMSAALRGSEKDIQLTLTFFFLSYGIAQLFVGSVLDSIGRYKPALLALGILVVSSLWISISNSILLIYWLRIIQGIATAILVVAKRAFFVDLYDSERRKHYLSYFTIVWSCGPIVAPFLGGYLQKLFGWQANFYFLAFYAVILLVLELIYSGETIAEKKPFRLGNVISQYRMMLGNRLFIMGIIILGLSYTVVLVFNISGPFVVEKRFGYNAVVVGYCTLVLGFSWMVGGFTGRRLVNMNFEKKVALASRIQLALIIGLLLAGRIGESLICFIVFAFFIHICSGLLYNIFFTDTMMYFPANAGLAGGLLGGMVYVITSASSVLISSVGVIATQNDMAFRYFVASVLLGVIVVYVVKQRRRKQTAVPAAI